MKQMFPTLYLFNNVFFPQTIIPLTVSDKASIDLLEKAYQQNLDVAFYHPSNRTNKIATVGRLILVEYNSNHTVTALVQGLTRVKLTEEVQHIPYPIFKAQPHQDIPENESNLHGAIERLQMILVNWLNRHISSQKEKEKFIKELDSPHKLINHLCLFIIKDVELKDIFLENTSLSEKIRMMDVLLKGQTPELEDVIIGEAIKHFEQALPLDLNKHAV